MVGNPAKRFGVRYGRRLKNLFAAIEIQEKQKHICPYCKYQKVKRVAKGIFVCKKCNARFTGRAYVPA